MTLNYKKVLFVLSIITSINLIAKEELKISAIDWCPQICPKTPKKPGYLVEMMKDLFQDSNYKLSFQFTPWSRAIHQVRTGQTDGLLSPSKDEAPDLVFHKSPLAHQTHCFWKLSNSKWNYSGTNSLKDVRFVIYRDHSYSRIFNEVFTKAGKDRYIEISYDDKYIDRAISLLKSKRAETFLFTANSVIFHQNKKSSNLELGKCIKKDELWFGLSPKNQKRINPIKKHIDDNLDAYKKTEKYQKLLKKYDILFPEVI